jgi:glycosyltransferase involved in cell wall biosynthesis
VVKRVAFAVPGDLATPTGGYTYDRRMIAELRRLGWEVEAVDLGEGFPHPDPAIRAAAAAKLAEVPKGCPIVIDGLAFGALPEVAGKMTERNPLIALVHHPLAFETGLSEQSAEALFKSEREALVVACGAVAVSSATAQLLIDEYDVPPELIAVVSPGTDPGIMAEGSSDGVVRLLAVGSIVPRKGFDVLIAALATLADLPWRLTIAGDNSRDAAAAASLDEDIGQHGLGERIDVLGTVADDRLASLYTAADLFVLASRFEGYGMAYAQALAHGVPIVGTTAGAIPDTVPPQAGILVEPNDVDALARTLRLLIENREERAWLASGARAAAGDLPNWRDQAKLLADAIEALG